MCALETILIVWLTRSKIRIVSVIMKHNVGRFTGPVSGHAGSLFYYFPVVVLLTLPFTALLVPVAQKIKAIWRDELQLYLLLWFLFVFVFFSVSGT